MKFVFEIHQNKAIDEMEIIQTCRVNFCANWNVNFVPLPKLMWHWFRRLWWGHFFLAKRKFSLNLVLWLTLLRRKAGWIVPWSKLGGVLANWHFYLFSLIILIEAFTKRMYYIRAKMTGKPILTTLMHYFLIFPFFKTCEVKMACLKIIRNVLKEKTKHSEIRS